MRGAAALSQLRRSRQMTHSEISRTGMLLERWLRPFGFMVTHVVANLLDVTFKGRKV